MPGAKPKKVVAKKGKKGAPKKEVEDLDLDVNRFFREQDDEAGEELDLEREAEEEEFIVQDKRNFKKQDILEVLPSEAHKLDDLAGSGHKRGFEPGERGEEEQLAVETAKKRRANLHDDDFDLGGVNKKAAKNKQKALEKGRKILATGAADDQAAVIEKVERDFSAISSEEKLKMLQKESPEVLQLVEDFNSNMQTVKELSAALHKLLHGKKAPADQQHLVSFLETKVQLMLSYCMHVTFYLLLKMEGQKVNNHPVVDRLVELRTYLEKLWPMEQKLQYSLKELLAKGVKSAAAAAADGKKARVGQMRAVDESTTKTLQKAAATNASKIELRKNMKKVREMESIEEEEMKNMSRGMARKKPVLSVGMEDLQSGGIGDGYHEKEDQYFSSMMGGDDDDDEEDDFDDDEDFMGEDSDDEEGGVSLVDKLRAKVGKKSKTHHGETAKSRRDAEFNDDLGSGGDEDEDEDYGSDDDDLMGDEGFGDDEDFEGEEGEEDLFDELMAEEQENKSSAFDDFSAGQQDNKKSVLDKENSEKRRRQINNKIKDHRGLTKVRPKDRKTPRTNQRRKFEIGERKAKAQTRSKKDAPEDFHGVASLKPHVTHSTKY